MNEYKKGITSRKLSKIRILGVSIYVHYRVIEVANHLLSSIYGWIGRTCNLYPKIDFGHSWELYAYV